MIVAVAHYLLGIDTFWRRQVFQLSECLAFNVTGPRSPSPGQGQVVKHALPTPGQELRRRGDPTHG